VVLPVLPAFAASWYSLTPAIAYAKIGTLNGGAEYDTFSVQPGDDPRGPLANASTPQYKTTFTDVSPNQSTLTDANLRGVGGRINHVAGMPGPGNNQTFYAASEYGGLWKTTDQGRTWNPVTGSIPQVTWDVQVSPPVTINGANVQPVYATSWFDGRLDTQAGIQVSYDTGQTWISPVTARPDPIIAGMVVDNTPEPPNQPNGNNQPFTSYQIDPGESYRKTEFQAFGIGIRPDAPQHVAIGTSAGLALSDDAGRTWRFVNPYPNKPAQDIWSVVYQPAMTNVGDAKMNYPDGIIHIYGDYGYQQSTDGGKTWSTPSSTPVRLDKDPNTGKLVPGGADLGLASLAVSPDEPWVVFVVVSGERTKAGNYGDDSLYESDNAGMMGQDWSDRDQIDPQGRVPFVATHAFGVGQYDVWYGDVQLFRATAKNPTILGPTTAASGQQRVSQLTDGRPGMCRSKGRATMQEGWLSISRATTPEPRSSTRTTAVPSATRPAPWSNILPRSRSRTTDYPRASRWSSARSVERTFHS